MNFLDIGAGISAIGIIGFWVLAAIADWSATRKKISECITPYCKWQKTIGGKSNV